MTGVGRCSVSWPWADAVAREQPIRDLSSYPIGPIACFFLCAFLRFPVTPYDVSSLLSRRCVYSNSSPIFQFRNLDDCKISLKTLRRLERPQGLREYIVNLTLKGRKPKRVPLYQTQNEPSFTTTYIKSSGDRGKRSPQICTWYDAYVRTTQKTGMEKNTSDPRPHPYRENCTLVFQTNCYVSYVIQGGFAGGLDRRQSPARVMPKMLVALWRRTEIRRNAKRRMRCTTRRTDCCSCIDTYVWSHNIRDTHVVR